MKKILVLVMAVLFAAAMFAGCAKPATETPADSSAPAATAAPADTAKPAEEKAIKFGYVVNDMSHEWYQNIVKGAQARAAELGIEIKVSDAAMDAAKQVTQLENMITEGVGRSHHYAR